MNVCKKKLTNYFWLIRRLKRSTLFINDVKNYLGWKTNMIKVHNGKKFKNDFNCDKNEYLKTINYGTLAISKAIDYCIKFRNKNIKLSDYEPKINMSNLYNSILEKFYRLEKEFNETDEGKKYINMQYKKQKITSHYKQLVDDLKIQYPYNLCDDQNYIFLLCLSLYNYLVFEGKLKLKRMIIFLQKYNSVYMRYFLSYCGDKYNVELKKKNLIHLYGLENLFGYRLDQGDEEEVYHDAIKWFGTENEKDVIQKNFFYYYFDEAMRYKFPNQNERYNLRKTISFDYINQFNADGSASGQKKMGKKGRMEKEKLIGINKTVYFNDMDEEEYNNIFFSKEIIGKSDSKLILKAESVKVRGVVNTDIHSYPILTKITKCIQNKLQGKIGIYPAMTNKQKIQLSTLFSYYISYNVNKGNKYIFLPLDYSKFDHTISRKLIIQCMRQFSPYMTEVIGYDDMVNSFDRYLDNHYVSFTLKKWPNKKN